MTRMAFTLASRLIYNDLSLRYAGRRGDEVDWASDRTQERFTFTDAEIASMMRRKEATFLTTEDRKNRPPTAHPDDVSPADRAEAERKLEYVLDMHRTRLAHRARLKDFIEQIGKTQARLGDRIAPSDRMVKRWINTCGEKPHWLPLVDGTRRKGNRDLRLTPAQIDIVDAMIDKHYMQLEGCSIEGLVPVVANAVRIANLDRPTAEKIGSIGRKAIVSVLALRDQKAIDTARKGPGWAANIHNRVTLQSDPKAPLDRIEVDHTLADLFVVSDEDGLPIGRPTIGFAIDRCTRMPFGLYAGFEPPSLLTVMQILKNGIFPKDYVRAKIDSGDWNFKHDWPVWGMPRMLVFDLALENRSHELKQATREIGIREILFVARKSGNQKGAVERWFKSQNQRLLHQQRGTTYSNVIQRGDYNPKKNAVISMSRFLKMVHRYFVDYYPFDEHGGLDDDLPYRRWCELIDRHPSDPVLPLDEMVHLFTRSKPAMLRREGVRLKSMYYSSDELDAERLSAKFAKASPRRQVLVRYDPADLAQVWVKLPHIPDRYLAVPVQPRWAEYATGKSVWEHDETRRHHRKRFGLEYSPETLGEVREQIADDMDEAANRTKKTRQRKRQARMDGNARISMHGNNAATTPAGSAHDRRQKAEGRPTPANDAQSQRARRTPATATRFPNAKVIAFGSSKKDKP